MVILGIDPGSRVTGYGFIRSEAGRFVYVASGCIRLPHGALGERLQAIFMGLSSLIAEYRPEEFAIEQVFMHRNANAALKLGQARGAAIVAAMSQGLDVMGEYSPREIKQAVVGYGAADKTQVQHMVTSLLQLSALPQADAADGLAVALCHAQSRALQRRLQAAEA